MEKVNVNTINFSKIALVTMLILAILFSAKQCHENNRLTANFEALNIEIKTYKLKNGQNVSKIKTLQLTKDELEDLVVSQNEEIEEMYNNFSKVKAVYITKEVIKIDSIIVPFEVKVPFEFERTGLVENEWYEFGYKIDQNGFKIEPFSTWNDQTIITGFQRKWFLGKQTLTTEITNTNPYLYNENIQAVQVVIPKRFYDTRAFNVCVGLIGGFLLAK